jgi:hypothetical protein
MGKGRLYRQIDAADVYIQRQIQIFNRDDIDGADRRTPALTTTPLIEPKRFAADSTALRSALASELSAWMA